MTSDTNRSVRLVNGRPYPARGTRSLAAETPAFHNIAVKVGKADYDFWTLPVTGMKAVTTSVHAAGGIAALHNGY